jgi:hypothetical protein
LACETLNDEINQFFYFPSAVYTKSKPDFVDIVKAVSYESFSKQPKEVDEIYPVRMSHDLREDSRLADFSQYVLQTAWNILGQQGYANASLNTFFTGVWTQEHHKHSLMEQHVHGGMDQLVGFYFLDCPTNCSRVFFHDPRPGKVQINLPEANMAEVTYGNNMVNFAPEPGLLMFSNAWLPHSFGRHAANEPLTFVHFNIGVQFAQTSCPSHAEII